jgi:Acetoacetate decarboxylase (ADC)
MGKYIEFPGEQTLRPPGDCGDTRFFYFLLRADHDRLRALCDRYFNEPSGGACSYEPLGIVLLAFTHVERLSSADPLRGTITYKDIAFWVPVWGGKTASLCLFPPFIFVDEAGTLVTGREVFGLPKQLGRFQMPLRFEDLAEAPAPAFRAEVAGTLEPGGPVTWHTLVTVDQIAKEEGADHGRLLSLLEKLLVPEHLRSFKVPDWVSHLTAVPALGLKQFRDASEPERACYQAIVEAPLSIVELFGPPKILFDAFEVTLMNLSSHPVAQILGLSDEPQRVPVTFYFEATMRMGTGTVVWSGV